MRVKKEFYAQEATVLAPQLLGLLLCRAIEGTITKLRITETECYYGEDDTACHAHKGKTKRTAVLYEQGGYAYVYLCYGIHSLLNVVTGAEGAPQAVLIRGVEGFSGPGKLTKALQVDCSLNREDLTTSCQIWLEVDGWVGDYEAWKRIGINYATEEYRDKLWRFVSKKQA